MASARACFIVVLARGHFPQFPILFPAPTFASSSPLDAGDRCARFSAQRPISRHGRTARGRASVAALARTARLGGTPERSSSSSQVSLARAPCREAAVQLRLTGSAKSRGDEGERERRSASSALLTAPSIFQGVTRRAGAPRLPLRSRCPCSPFPSASRFRMCLDGNYLCGPMAGGGGA